MAGTPYAPFVARVERILTMIPAGRVATYGQVAALAGFPRGARMVGWVLSHSYRTLPWQRVVNREGRLSIIHDSLTAEDQARLLRAEGTAVSERDDALWVDLTTVLWDPVAARRSTPRA